MIKFIKIFMLMLAFVGSASAQTSGFYEGDWKAKWIWRGETYEATLNVNGVNGRWHQYLPGVPKKSYPCANRDFEISVLNQTDKRFTFKVELSRRVSACEDWTIWLERVDENTLKTAAAYITQDYGGMTLTRENPRKAQAN